MKYKPCGHFVQVKMDVVEEMSKGGIVLVKENQDREQAGKETGVIVAIGHDCWDFTDKPWAKVGDRVLFRRYEGVDPRDKDSLYRFLNDDTIIAVITE